MNVISRDVTTTVRSHGQFESSHLPPPPFPNTHTLPAPQLYCQESASSFFNFLECICCCCAVRVAPLQGHHPHVPASLKSILIKYPVSIPWCKSERPHQSAAALRLLLLPLRLKIQYLNRGILLGRSDFCWAATLLSGCFHLALRPSGEASLDFPALLFSRKGFVSPCDTIYVSGLLFL